MKPRFAEMKARSMRDETEIQPRWMRDGCEIWRDAGLCKFSQCSRTLSKLQRIILSGEFRVLLHSSRTTRSGDIGDKPRPCHRSQDAKTSANIDLSPMSDVTGYKSLRGERIT